MMEHESDILLAEPEVETKEEPQQNSDFVETYESPKQNTQENKTVKKETSTFVNYNNNRLNKVYKKYDVVQTYVPKKEDKSKTNKDFDTWIVPSRKFTSFHVRPASSPRRTPVFSRHKTIAFSSMEHSFKAACKASTSSLCKQSTDFPFRPDAFIIGI